jgi:hypothetical protein
MATTRRHRETGSARAEEALVRRALAGDRDAFDRLYDRYFDLVARYLRRHGPTEIRRLMRETLEELFGTLGTAEPPLAERAYRIARAASRRTAHPGPVAVRSRAERASPRAPSPAR